MDAFKLERLMESTRRNPAVDISKDFMTIGGDFVRAALARRTGMSDTVSGSGLLQKLTNLSSPLPGLKAEVERFSFSVLLQNLQRRVPEWVYLNWHDFEAVDKVRTDLLDRYFDDIWYPGSDDLDIIDEHFEWVVTVDHEGYIRTNMGW